MHNLAQPVISWLERNLIPIAKNALLKDRRVAWGGRFQHGKKVPVGVAVMYIDKLMLAVSDNQDTLPTEGARGFQLLCDLKHMRVTDDPFITSDYRNVKSIPKTRESAVASAAMQYGIQMVEQKAAESEIDGFYAWRGIYHAGYKYKKDDLIAYDGAVYKAITGDGVPTSKGWERLDGRSRSSGLAIIRTYVVDDDGNYVVDDGGNYVVSN